MSAPFSWYWVRRHGITSSELLTMSSTCGGEGAGGEGGRDCSPTPDSCMIWLTLRQVLD